MALNGQDVKCKTLTEAYRRQGIAEAKSIRQAWSQQCDDGTVVLTLWADQFEDASRQVFNTLNEPLGAWVDKWPNRQRIDHLKHVRSLADPAFKSIIVIPAGPGQRTRRQLPGSGQHR
jgi:hypothetical protein